MSELIAPLVASFVGVLVGVLLGKFLKKKYRHLHSTIEFSVGNGRTQRVKVPSLEPDVVREAVEDELQLEDLLRSAVKEISRANGRIKFVEGGIADLIVRLDDRLVIVEAKASTGNIPDDFISLVKKEFSDINSILFIVGKNGVSEKTIFHDGLVEIVKKVGKDVEFKRDVSQKILSLLKAS